MAMAQSWKITGELLINCNCTVFCPCVISLGQHPPTEGSCHAWGGVHIDEGVFGTGKLDGLNVGLLLDIPGRMTDGNWSVALYIDERASAEAADALTQIFTGTVGGSTRVLRMLTGTLLGVKTVPIQYDKEGARRRFTIPHIISGTVEPIRGEKINEPVTITNSAYWISSSITVCQGSQSRLRDFGRVWDFSGKSAEICQIQWSGA